MKPEQADPLVKREKFAVSLRKKKKQEILSDKRKRITLPTTQNASKTENVYRGCSKFFEDQGL